ncbi:MAG: malonyl-ACP O-methyltransferase BioC [Tannerellaceae bacterium]
MEEITTRRIHQRFARALESYDHHAEAQHRISLHLAKLLTTYGERHFSRALEIGCGTGGFTRCLKSCCTIDEWVLNDLCPECTKPISHLFPGGMPEFIAGDAETVDFRPSFDLIASASAFQWIKDQEHFIGRLAELLRPSGRLFFSTFAPGNLEEIHRLTGCGLCYPSAEQLTNWLSPYFHLLHVEEEEIILRFAHPLDVLRHLKQTGVTATANDIAWTRSRQTDFCRRYTQQYATADQQVTLTYRPLYIVAVKR